MIFESTGGVSVEADRVLKSLNKAVAVNTSVSETLVATLFWQRVGVDLLRGASRSFHRRLAVRDLGDTSGGVWAGGLVLPGGS